MADEPRKRSRFDQTESEPRKTSRFDRRSRSPSARQADSTRSRSPLDQSMKSPTNVDRKDPAAAAAAAAARINAQIQAKKGIQHVDVPSMPPTTSTLNTTPAQDSSNVDGDIYQQDGDHIKDIEVNDLRNRYTLTKGSTQKMIKDETGADVTTRGSYYPDKTMATAASPPLYLHVTSTSKDGLKKAVAKIDELMKQELPNLIDERRFRRREPEQVELDERGRRKWPEQRIPIDLEPIPGFNLRAQVVGHAGTYVKHIQGETRCRVQIKGQGSGYTERDSGQESDEPMYLHVAGPDANEVQRAKELCEDLLGNVKEQYLAFKQRGPQRRHDGGQDRYNGGGRSDYGNGGYGQRDSRDSQAGAYGDGSAAATNPMSPTSADAAGYDYSQYYAAQAGGQDPYAAYGGYQAYVAMYYQWYQQQQGADGTVPGVPAGSPPPPPGEAPPPAPGAPDQSQQPPPPPPAASPPAPPGVSGYSAVPPPPGL